MLSIYQINFIFHFIFAIQSAVGYEYEGKTEKHASQKGENA